MSRSKQDAFLKYGPVAAFLIINVVLVLAALKRPSFAAVGIIYSLNTIVAASIFLVLGIAGRPLRRNKSLLAKMCAPWRLHLVIGLVLVAARIYMTHIEPHRLVLREVQIQSSKLDRTLRILHFSDIQSAAIGPYEERVFREIRELEPDLIIHTGDLLHPIRRDYAEEFPKLAALFKTLEPPLGVYGVHGNVDTWARSQFNVKIDTLRILENTAARIEFGGTTIQMYGMSPEVSGTPDVARELIGPWVSSLQEDEFSLLLGHSPDYMAQTQDFPIDLCLAGHTHGGQVRLPFIGPLVTCTFHIPRSWALGYREIGRTRLNTSGGVGCEHVSHLPSIRFNCPPEMTLITIVPTHG